MEKEIYRKFKEAKTVILIEVLEGAGTVESPKEINSYIISNDGRVLGSFKNHEVYKEIDNLYATTNVK